MSFRSGFPVTGVDLSSDHKPNGVRDIVVSVEYGGKWVEVIRAPDGGEGSVLGHSVYMLGLRDVLDGPKK